MSTTKVTLTKGIGGNKEGDTIEVIPQVAERLIARGVAEKPKRQTKSAD